ncbi:cytochrome P450 4C1 isoform X1 [Ceratina calcarata]|uniref:Cytochrome P450 4C1 isoform X1 n=1 Tax=Ceratina calcarata TaxID=156304 RepID=A0AAJ7W901_9HYME|nr:cytochrome P450 4C1 isoform X1 [Ceratina calcarata]
MITTILLLVLLAICLHYYLLHFGKYGKIINLIPGPQPKLIFGNLLFFHVSLAELWKDIRKLNNQYYPISRLWGLWEAFINIRHPDDIEIVIGQSRFLHKSNTIYRIMLPWFGTGLLTSTDRKWQTRRKILTPAFHFNMLREFTDVFIQEGERLVGKLKSEGRPVVKDLKMLISEHTLNIICETAMGTSLIDKGDFQFKYRKAVHDVGNSMLYRLFRPWLCIDFVFFLTPVGMLQSRLLKILHGFTKQIIKERKEYHDKTNVRYLADLDGNANEETDDMTCSIRKKRLAMLDLLLSAHRHNLIDDEGIREEVDTFMFRGHDTTAISICFTIMLLAEHSQIQDRARTEVKEVMEASNGKLSMSDLQKLPYLEMCIKESLRLYPSVPLISRAPEEDVTLSNYLVPAHSTVSVHIYDTHRDPTFWPNPDVFDPERFTPENCRGRHPYSYIPFSAGPRNCIVEFLQGKNSPCWN